MPELKNVLREPEPPGSQHPFRPPDDVDARDLLIQSQNEEILFLRGMLRDLQASMSEAIRPRYPTLVPSPPQQRTGPRDPGLRRAMTDTPPQVAPVPPVVDHEQRS